MEKIILAQKPFLSIEGESLRQGLPVVFVRFQGCNLRCKSEKYPECHCDSEYSFSNSPTTFITNSKELISLIKEFNCNNISITGGEPLLHENSLRNFLDELSSDDQDFDVTIETNGSLSFKWIKEQYPFVRIIGDWKCPVAFGKKTNESMLISNLYDYDKNDALKFVVTREDLTEVEKILKEYEVDKRTNVYLSPAWGCVEFKEVAQWILNHPEFKTRLSIQIHKIIYDKDDIWA